MDSSLLAELTSQVWAIDPSVVQGYLPLAVKLAKGETQYNFGELKQQRQMMIEQTRTKFATFAAGVGHTMIDSKYSFNNLEMDTYAIVGINGVMRKSGGWCAKGTEETMDELNLAGSHNRVKGVLLKIHSPGGSVFGTESLANLARDFEAMYEKPLMAYVCDQACSAGYWVASQCPSIMLAGNTSVVGCIGVMSTIYNYEAYYEMNGIREIIALASKSFNKNKAYTLAAQGDTSLLQSEVLDPLNETFLKTVRSGRKGKIQLSETVEMNGVKVPLVLAGGTFYGKDAIKRGLADSTGSMSDAIAELDKKYRRKYRNKSGKPSASHNLEEMELKEQLQAVNGMNEDELTAFVADDSKDELAKNYANSRLDVISANKKFEEAETAKGSTETALNEANTAKDSLQAELDQANTSLAEKDSTIEGLNTKVTELEASLNTANDSLQEANNSLEEANAANEKNGKVIAAYKGFVDKHFEAGTSDKFTVNEEGAVSQPEVQRKVVIKSAAQKRAEASVIARELAGA